ncbi:hypothetical protein FNV43_RR13023 [Rhamnella rubrinervis]|uniref:Uncharacterized protein n=1 Tax=Rhamnella rubrinervis TaxID=2594499 RepID=A0A8K0H098_9ROSA|nr:hypothetical protein FNV43_RR13023 [Rhamnella rubrinervis]
MRRHDDVMLLNGQTTVVPSPSRGHFYFLIERFEQDSMGSEDYVAYSYSLEPVDLDNFDLWDDPAND